MFPRSAALAALSLIAAVAGAQPVNYAQRGTQIRAGVLLIDSAQTGGVPTNATPFVWYNLDSNKSVKPAGWNIFNPNAPGQATQPIVDRWTILNGFVGGGAPALNDRISKRNAAYWEVRLSQVSDTQMAQYDVLFLNAAGNVSLNPLEREKLRQFVDRGGVLWVETANITVASFDLLYTINNFPLPFTVAGPSGGGGNLDVFHPVLNYPYSFNISNLDYLNNGGTGNVLNQANPPGAAGALNPSIPADWFKLKPVVLSGGAATLMVGRIGDGFMVVTSRDAARYLNRIKVAGGYLPNNQYYAGDVNTGLDKGSDLLGKLAVNVISLGSSSEQPGNGTRKSGSSPIDISAPLLKRFNDDIPGLDQGARSPFPVAAYKNLAVVVSNNTVFVYDANPKNDLDGDGNPDDGFQDYSLGNDRDLVWRSNALPGPISAATCAEVAQTAGTPTDQIMVTLGDGSVAVFNAFPTNAGGQIQPGPHGPAYTVAPPTSVSIVDTSVISHGPYAPTYHEGLVYVATNPGTPNPTGQVWMFDPATGNGLNTSGQRWLVGDPLAPAIQQISASPTVGYVPIADNSGGLDRIVYVPTRPGSTLAGPNAGIYSLWAGARGESPIAATPVGPNLTVTTRANQRGLWLVTGGGPLAAKLTVLRANGDPLTIADMNALFSGTVLQSAPGVLEYQLIGIWDPTYTVRVDYTVDWGRGPAASQSIVRGNIFLPDDPNFRRTILGNIAMSARGTIYVVHSTGDDQAGPGVEGGAFYAFREQGQGAFRCLTRFDAYRRHTVNLNQAAAQQVPATVSDNDPLNSLVPVLGGTAERVTFVGGPVVRGDFVYAPAVMRKSNPSIFFAPFIPHTVLMAFKAEPEAPEIQVGDLTEGFSLIQPDMIRSTNKTNPTQFNVANQGQFQYIRSSGKIRFDNLMTPNRGQISNCFSLSQPVILRSGGRPDQLIYPDSLGGSRWSPMAWYTVLHGFGQATTPVVTGGTLFMGGSSGLPELILGGNPINPSAVLFGMNADISERDAFNLPDAARPWLRQAVVLKDNGGGNIDTNPNIRWPQSQGITSFQVWATRVLQTSMGPGRAMSVAAGEGGLFATSGPGTASYGAQGSFYGFSRSDFLVCDEGRFGRYDPSGNPIMATDVTNASGTEVNIGGATSVRALQRPTRAYPLGASDVVVVDPTTNRVVRLDSAGRQLRSVESFRLDPASGISLQANEPLSLNNPRDVAVFTEYVANPTGVSNPQALEFWVHYVIADSGNRRIIDVIDRYVAAANRTVGDLVSVGGERQLGVLRWHSPAEYSGKRFEYNSISRAAFPGNPNQYWYIAGIGNATPTRVDAGLDSPIPAGTEPREAKDGNGGIIIFNPFGTNHEIINEVNVPAIGPNILVAPSGTAYDPVGRPAYTKKLINLTSVTVKSRIVGGNSVWAIMFTDATGVYEVAQVGGNWNVIWMMPNEVYRFLRKNKGPGAPVPFPNNPLWLRANYARRLDSGEVLIVNGFVGKRWDGADFSGEVVQVNGDPFGGANNDGYDVTQPNLGFDFSSVRFELNTLTETRKLYQPVFADRR